MPTLSVVAEHEAVDREVAHVIDELQINFREAVNHFLEKVRLGNHVNERVLEPAQRPANSNKPQPR